MTSFRKYTALTCLVLFLFSNVELHELLKLPGLWVHYQEHQQETNQPLSFQAFLKMHYNEEIPAEHPGHHHEKLPFKDESGCAHGIAVGLLHHDEKVIWYLPMASPSQRAKIPTYDPLSCPQGIWQPPRCS